jgi:hypothetical protein
MPRYGARHSPCQPSRSIRRPAGFPVVARRRRRHRWRTFRWEANGRLLMGASYKEGVLSVSRIGSDGSVQAPPSQMVMTPPKAHCILPGRSREVIYATTVEGNAILIFRIDVERGDLVPACRGPDPGRHGSEGMSSRRYHSKPGRRRALATLSASPASTR